MCSSDSLNSPLKRRIKVSLWEEMKICITRGESRKEYDTSSLNIFSICSSPSFVVDIGALGLRPKWAGRGETRQTCHHRHRPAV